MGELVSKLPWGWLLLIAVLLTACEYPGVQHPLAVVAEAEKGPTAALAPRTPQSSQSTQAPQPKDGTGSTVLQGRVGVTQKDFKLEPDSLTVKAGAVTFVLKNEGRYTHDFRVEGPGVDQKAPKVGSGRTLEWKITLKPETYRISCPVSNHADRGMVGALTIVP